MEKPDLGRGTRREQTGVVVRAKVPQSVVVEIERLSQHPRYRKVIRRRKRYMVHDEKGVGKVGDKVRIVESRPLSKTKHWRLAEVL